MADVLLTLILGGMMFLIMAYYLNNRKQRPPNYPPGPKGIPVFGNILDIKKSDAHGPSILSNWAAQFGDVYSLRLGSYDAIALNTPQVIREVFSKLGEHTTGRFTNVFFYKIVFGKIGIVMNDGDDWKATRRAALRSLRDFGMGKKSLEQRVQEETQQLVDMMASQGSQAFNPKMMISNVPTNVICSIVFGDRYDYDDEEYQTLTQGLNHMFKIGGFKNPELFIPIFFPFIPIIQPQIFKATRLIYHVRSVIKEHIRKHRETFDPNDIKSFIDIFLKAEQDGELCNKKTEENLLASIFDLFVAGSETTGTTLHWALLYLVHNPRVQDKCQIEIKEKLGPVRTPAVSDRPSLPYVEAMIHEIQRVSSIVAYGLLHRTTDTIECSGYTIPRDTLLLPNIHGIHTNKAYWGDPEAFRPERWLSEDGTLLKHDAYMPFSIGPRECPGKSLAFQEIFIVLVSLLQRFRFSAKDPDNPPPIHGTMGISYSPDDYEVIASPL